jgi:WD40 repeat protein
VNIATVESGCDDRMSRSRNKRNYYLSRLAIQIVAAVAVAGLPLLGHADSAPNLLSKRLGSNMNSVVVKVAELSEENSKALVRGLDFGPDGSRLAIDAVGPNISIWDWRNRRVDKTLLKPEGGNDLAAPNPLFYSPDGSLLVNCEQSGAGNVVARIWNVPNGMIAKDIIGGPKPTEPGGCTAAGFSPSGKLFFVTSDTGKNPKNNVHVYGTAAFEPIWGLSIAQHFQTQWIAVSPDEELLGVAGMLMYLKDGTVTNQPNIYIVSIRQQKVVKVIPTEAMGALAWSPDGQRIAVVGRLIAEIVDVQTGKEMVHEKLEKSGSMNVRFTPDGKYLIESDLNGMGRGLGVKIWDGHRQSLLQVIPGDIGSIAVSRDSKYLAVGETGHTAIWQFQ